MAADKEISELNSATLAILNGASRIDFVAQIPEYGIDFRVTADILRQYLGQSAQFNILSGTGNPDNASGSNNDLYVQSNGKIYRKESGAWILKATINSGSGSGVQYTRITIPAGSAIPYTASYPTDYNANCIIQTRILTSRAPTYGEDVSDILIVRNDDGETIDIYGHGDTTFNEDTLIGFLNVPLFTPF